MELPGFVKDFAKKWTNSAVVDETVDIDDDSTNMPEPEKPSPIVEDVGPVIRGKSLATELILLNAAGLTMTTRKAKEAYEHCKLEAEKNKLFTALLNEIGANMDDNGNCTTTSAHIQDLFAKTAPHGVRLAKGKTSLTKKEVDTIRHKLDGLVSDCQHEMKLKSHNLQKCENDHRTFVQEVKSLFDKFFEIIRKFLMGISSRG